VVEEEEEEEGREEGEEGSNMGIATGLDPISARR